MRKIGYRLICQFFLCQCAFAQFGEVAYDTEDCYVPYPVVFTHGYNADWKSWWDSDTRKKFDSLRKDKYGYRAWHVHNRYNGYRPSLTNIVAEAEKGDNKAIGSAVSGFNRALEDSLTGASGTAEASKLIAAIPDNQPCVVTIMHSFGGLVTRGYIQKHPDDHRLSRLVFVGTPHLGSPLGNYMYLACGMRKRIREV